MHQINCEGCITLTWCPHTGIECSDRHPRTWQNSSSLKQNVSSLPQSTTTEWLLTVTHSTNRCARSTDDHAPHKAIHHLLPCTCIYTLHCYIVTDDFRGTAENSVHISDEFQEEVGGSLRYVVYLLTLFMSPLTLPYPTSLYTNASLSPLHDYPTPCTNGKGKQLSTGYSLNPS